MSASTSPLPSSNPAPSVEATDEVTVSLGGELNIMLDQGEKMFDHLFDNLGLRLTTASFPWNSEMFDRLVDKKFAVDMKERDGCEALLLERKEGGGRLSDKERDVLQRVANIIWIPILIVQTAKLWWRRSPEADPEGIFPDFTHQLDGEYWHEDLDDLMVWFDQTRNERTPPLGHEPGSPSSTGRFSTPKDHRDDSVSKDVDLASDL